MNILINLFTEDIPEEKIKEYSSAFKTFEVHHYQFKLVDMFPDILGAIIGHIQEQGSFDIKQSKIIFQTNVADIAHHSANFYSETIDGVIVVQDSVTALTTLHQEYDWILDIAQIKSYKLRLNNVCIVDDEFDSFYLEFAFFNELINSIKPIEDLALTLRPKSDYNLNFSTRIGEVRTNSIENNIISIVNEQKYWDTLLHNNYGMKLVGIALSQSMTTHSNYIDALELLVNNSYLFNDNEQFLKFLSDYIPVNKLTLPKLADYHIYRMMLGDTKVLKPQYAYLKENYNILNKSKVHSLIVNSLSYEGKYHQEKYFGYFEDRIFIMRQLTEYWRERIHLTEPKRKPNKVAIFAGQLLSDKHAPTQWVITYANMLKKNNPLLEVKIFVDDWANYSPDDLGWKVVFLSIDSSICNEIHKKHLHPDIEIYYSNSNLNRTERIQQDVNSIVDFQPEVIYKMGSKYSIAANLLHTYYPIISHTMGGMEDSEYVDIFTGGYTEDIAAKLYQEQGLYNVNYLSHIVGIETPESTEEKSRLQYGLENEAFILVTVGNRLDVEITQLFLDQMKQVLKQSVLIKWFIIGVTEIALISEQCSDYIDNGQIQYLKFESNLFDLYKICNIYVNPFRVSGGNSAAIAMKAGLPIVTADVASDVGGFVGSTNCVNEESIAIEAIKLIEDKTYYKEKSNEMLTRINDYFSFDRTYIDLQTIFSKAQDIYKKRQR